MIGGSGQSQSSKMLCKKQALRSLMPGYDRCRRRMLAVMSTQRKTTMLEMISVRCAKPVMLARGRVPILFDFVAIIVLETIRYHGICGQGKLPALVCLMIGRLQQSYFPKKLEYLPLRLHSCVHNSTMCCT